MNQYVFLNRDDDDYCYIIYANSWDEAEEKMYQHLVDKGDCEDMEDAREVGWEYTKPLDIEKIIK